MLAKGIDDFGIFIFHSESGPVDAVFHFCCFGLDIERERLWVFGVGRLVGGFLCRRGEEEWRRD